MPSDAQSSCESRPSSDATGAPPSILAAQAPEIAAGFKKMGWATAQRHAFLCIGPDCCGAGEGQATWEALKTAVKETGAPAMRTKAACLRLCTGGPWMVVYPEGTWYGSVTPEKVHRIAREHLQNGQPITEWAVVPSSPGRRSPPET